MKRKSIHTSSQRHLIRILLKLSETNPPESKNYASGFVVHYTVVYVSVLSADHHWPFLVALNISIVNNKRTSRPQLV